MVVTKLMSFNTLPKTVLKLGTIIHTLVNKELVLITKPTLLSKTTIIKSSHKIAKVHSKPP